MEPDILSAAIPAVIVIAVVLVLEDWVYFKAKGKLQRAAITGLAVFVIFLVINLMAGPSF